MRFSTAVLSGFAASALACNLETHPSHVDQFIRHRSVTRDADTELFTLEFADGSRREVTEEEKWDLKRAHIRFFDVSNELEAVSFASANSFAGDEVSIAAYPSSLSQGTAVNALIPQYNITNVRSTLTKFSSFYNRYYKSTYGAQSAQWLFEQVSAIATASKVSGVTVRKFNHTFANQFSVIATIPGKSAKTIVIGAHQDSINGNNPANGAAAGADDDGSGSMAIMEAFRVILKDSRIAAGQAENTIEFQWFSGEEAGLLGSQAIANAYAKESKPIAAMLQQDMVGYSLKKQMGLITDNTNAALNTFTKSIITGYTNIGFVETRCGYGCSDHASYTRAGYPASFVFEAAFDGSNPDIHTTRDTIDKVNFDHVLQHGKLILGWTTELAFASGI